MDKVFTYGFLGLCLLAIFMAARRFFDPPPPEPKRYLGSQLHYDAMLSTIEGVAARIVAAHPQEDEFQQTKRVRDELMLSKMHNVDTYEGTILSVVKRLRGRQEPTVQKWTD
jgi:hypothetical protein